MPRARRRRYELRGVVSSAGFATGDRFVIGHWLSSPIGAFTDVMWASPRDERVLLVPSEAALRFVSAIYAFDRAEIAPVNASVTSASLDVCAADIHIRLGAGRPRPIPLSRLPGFTRWVQGPIAWRTMGVHTYGLSPTGVREWYRASVYRGVVEGAASVAGADLGELAHRIDPPVHFGFSEPPRRPSMVWIRPMLEYPEDHPGPG